MLNQQNFIFFVSFLALIIPQVIRADEGSAGTGYNVVETSHPSYIVDTPGSSKTSESQGRSISDTTESPDFISSRSSYDHDMSRLDTVNLTTGLPYLKSILSGTTSIKPTTIVVTDHHEDDEPMHKFRLYLKPICDSIDNVLPKQLFRIQSQLKQFIQQTNGKLGTCFLDHYLFDPTLEPITKNNLVTICSSRNLPPDLKRSAKSFQRCAAKNWDPAVDKELDRIMTARLNCTKNHHHVKNDTSAAGLSNEEEEFSLISEVVSKVLADDQTFENNNTDIKVINFLRTTSPKPTQLLPTSNVSKTAVKTSSDDAKGLMNDPNTVVVFVDDSKATTLPPLISIVTHNKTTPTLIDQLISKNSTVSFFAHTTMEPNFSTSRINVILSTSVKPVLGGTQESIVSLDVTKEDKSNKTTNSLVHKILPVGVLTPPTSLRPLTLVSTTKPAITGTVILTMTTSQPTVNPDTTSKLEISTKGTLAPIESNIGSTIKVTSLDPINKETNHVPVKAIFDTTVTPISKLSTKSLETFGEMLKRQEKEKQDFETKLRLEREKIMKQLQKKQDEIDAQNAIRALEFQRQTSSSNHGSDNRLHQLEHDRQMSIDPIGHSIKHQQYEMNKQQRMMAGKK